MTEVFGKLKELQDILAEKYELQELISESPRRLDSQEELLTRLKQEYIELNKTYEDTREAVQSLRVELDSCESAREAGEKKMDSITTHREYEAVEREIKEASEKEQQVRKDLQRTERELDDLNDQLKQQEELIQGQEADLHAGREKLSGEISGYEQRLSDLIAQEKELLPGIDSEIMFKFERIIKSKHNRGIVDVKGNVCDGCHMILPAQFANEVRAGEQIVFCPYCSRILTYQEADDESQYFHMDDTGSLADLDDEFEDEDEDIDEAGEEHEELKDFEYDD